MTQLHVRIIRPSSRESGNLLVDRIKEFESRGIRVLYDETLPDPSWPFCSSTIESRLSALTNALTEKQSQIVWCARGGYGASDLLGQLPWEKLLTQKPKLVIGFSDASALHSALYAKLNWQSLHAPMPATTLWAEDNKTDDIEILYKLIERKQNHSEIDVTAVGDHTSRAPIEGTLFGGCMSVISQLIGTPYFPKSLKDHIIFWEDTGENPGRLMRGLNQWQQSGALNGVKALVLGVFRDCVKENQSADLHIYQQFAKRLKIPVFRSKQFGHTSPNFPLMIGAMARIQDGQLIWQDRQENLVG
jgi:muramoyltetrapeptide carboxypeptidase